jgi:hypothetical protein
VRAAARRPAFEVPCEAADGCVRRLEVSPRRCEIEQGVGQTPDPRSQAVEILARDAEQLRDGPNRQRMGEILDDVHPPVALDPIEKTISSYLDAGTYAFHDGRRQDLGHHAPDTRVVRRVLRDQNVTPEVLQGRCRRWLPAHDHAGLRMSEAWVPQDGDRLGVARHQPAPESGEVHPISLSQPAVGRIGILAKRRIDGVDGHAHEPPHHPSNGRNPHEDARRTAQHGCGTAQRERWAGADTTHAGPRAPADTARSSV